jgi:type IV secretory pathway VirJ component
MNFKSWALLAATILWAGCGVSRGAAAVPAAPAAAAAPAPKASTSAAAERARRAAQERPREGERSFEYGAEFGAVSLYMPPGKPKGVVIFLSGDGGWHLGVIDMARHLRDQGAAVAGIDVRRYLADVAATKGGGCRYMAADFETLAHRVEREMGLPDYQVPLLYGYSSGATVVYAVLVESPPGTFAAAVSLGFCPDQKFGGVALCPGGGPKLSYHVGDKGAWVFDPAPNLTDPWVAFQGESDIVCSPAQVDAFASKVGHSEVVRLPMVGHGFSVERNWLPQFQQVFMRLSTHSAMVPLRSAEVADLPLIEQPALEGHPAGNPAAPLVVLLTGDGGWAGLDRGLAAAFNERGVPVVALSTLQYFWHARTAEQTSADLARVLRHYLTDWKRERVLLVGYSFGADVLPFVVNRLPQELRARIASVNMLGLSDNASFEIHVAGWVPGSETGSAPVKPELARMRGIDALCLYGAGEIHDPCARFAGGSLTALPVGQGHHFGGEYDELAAAILHHAGFETPATTGDPVSARSPAAR